MSPEIGRKFYSDNLAKAVVKAESLFKEYEEDIETVIFSSPHATVELSPTRGGWLVKEIDL